jgi:hypothetical protein
MHTLEEGDGLELHLCDVRCREMTMRSLLLVFLLLAGSAYAEGVVQDSDGLPAAGTTINLKPTHTGYEAEIVLPAGKYTAAEVTSSDPAIKPFLTQRVEMQGETPSPPASQADSDKLSTSSPAGQPRPAKAPFAKLVTVVFSTGAIPQGQYRVSLKLAGAAPIDRDLTLAVPASHLDTLDTLVVISEWAKPGLFGDAKTANQPQMWETSQKGWLTHLTLDQKGQTDAGSDPAGRIKPKTAALADIRPGENGLVLLGRDYDLDGPFPLGAAKGKLVLKADQLSDPVTFNFEVRSRIWVAWLFVPMVVGLVMGYGARTWLVELLKVSQERSKCYDLIAVIDQALRENKDPTFKEAAEAARRDALIAVPKKKVEEIKRDTDAAQTRFQEARAALTQSRTEIGRTTAEFSAVVRANYRLPKAIRDALELARSTIDVDLTSAALNNVTAANETFRRVYLAVRETTLDTGRGWINAATALNGLIDLVGPAFGFTGLDDLRAKLKAIVDPVDAAITQLNNDTASNIAPLKAALDALHSNIYALHQFRDSISAAISRQVVHLEQILNGKPLPKLSDWNGWIEVAKTFAAAVGNLNPEDPDAAALIAAGFPLTERLRVVLPEQVANDALRTEIGTLLNDNKVVEAVVKVAEFVRPHAETETGSAPDSASRQVASESATQQSIQMPGAVRAPPTVYTTYPTVADLDASAIALLQARNERVIETAGLLQTVIFGFVIVAAGYFLFAEKWVGTPGDFAAVLFWAFATDIGADAATSVAKAFKKSG